MINKGVVQEINGEHIKVHLYRDSACAHCSGCDSRSKMGSSFNFKCDRNLSLGDIVTFEIEDSSLLNIAAVVYLMPAIFMIIGYFLGQNLGFNEGKRVLMSFIFLGISFAAIYFFDKNRGEKIIEKKIKIISIDKPDPENMIDSCSSDK
jgi:sigma-E factor negative regulatory protein RseC